MCRLRSPARTIESGTNKKLSDEKFSAVHSKKEVLFHLEEALKLAEALVDRNSMQKDKNLRDGLEFFIHNAKAGF